MAFNVTAPAPPAFVGQRGRKLFIPVTITISGIAGGGGPDYRYRVTRLEGSLQILPQEIADEWAPVPAVGFTIDSVQTFAAAPAETIVWLAFFDGGVAGGVTNYSTLFQIEILDAADRQFGHATFTIIGTATALVPRSVVFALDRGKTMANAASSGTAKIELLRTAACRMLPLFRATDSLGIVSFNTTAPTLVPFGLATNALILQATNACNATGPGGGLEPKGFKSIQKGIDAGRALSPAAKVITISDGITTRDPQLPGEPKCQPAGTFAIAIDDEAAEKETFPLMTSADGNYSIPSPTAAGLFTVEKHLTQILLDIAGEETLSDPDSSLKAQVAEVFPIDVTEADRQIQLIIYSDKADWLDVHLTKLPPPGNIPDKLRAGVAAVQKPAAPDVALDGPEDLESVEVRGQGTLLRRINIPNPGLLDGFERLGARVSRPAGDTEEVRFSIIVSAFSDLRLKASFESSGTEVGAMLLFSALVEEYGVPPVVPIKVKVELRHPDKGVEVLELQQVAPGRFERTRASFRAGTYEAHFVATGTSRLKKRPFRREALRTIVLAPAGSTSRCCSAPPTLWQRLIGRVRDHFRAPD